MDRRMRTNLLLAAVVLVLGLAIWLVPEPAKETGYALLDPETISEITVRQNGETHLRLSRDGEDWRIVEPFALPADPFQLDALLATLGETASGRYSIGEANLAELGLEDPEWTVQVDEKTLQLGGRTAIGNRRYIRAGETIYLVNDVLGFRLKRPALDYASRRVLPERARITAIELPDGARIERMKSGWTIKPGDAGVSADALQSLVDAWRRATAMNVAAANSVPRDGTVVVEFADGKVLRFGVELTDDELKLTRDEPAVTYTLPASEAGALLEIVSASPETSSE